MLQPQKKWSCIRENKAAALSGRLRLHICMFVCISRYSLLGATMRQQPAAIAAPRNGPTMNTHNSSSAFPPSKSAGPIERAGLTEVPV